MARKKAKKYVILGSDATPEYVLMNAMARAQDKLGLNHELRGDSTFTWFSRGKIVGAVINKHQANDILVIGDLIAEHHNKFLADQILATHGRELLGKLILIRGELEPKTWQKLNALIRSEISKKLKSIHPEEDVKNTEATDEETVADSEEVISEDQINEEPQEEIVEEKIHEELEEIVEEISEEESSTSDPEKAEKNTDEVDENAEGENEDADVHGGNHASSEVEDSDNPSEDGEKIRRRRRRARRRTPNSSGDSHESQESSSDSSNSSNSSNTSSVSNPGSKKDFSILSKEDIENLKNKIKNVDSKKASAFSLAMAIDKLFNKKKNFQELLEDTELTQEKLKNFAENFIEEVKAIVEDLTLQDPSYVKDGVEEGEQTIAEKTSLNAAYQISNKEYWYAEVLASKINFDERRARKLFDKILGSIGGDEESPRVNKKEVVRRLAMYKNPYMARKHEISAEKVMLCVDTSGSMHGFIGLAKLAIELSKIHENLIISLNSNMWPWGIVANGKFQEVQVADKEVESYYKTLGTKENIKYIININDRDGLDIALSIARNLKLEKFVWIDNYGSSYDYPKLLKGNQITKFIGIDPSEAKRLKIDYWSSVSGKADDVLDVIEKSLA